MFSVKLWSVKWVKLNLLSLYSNLKPRVINKYFRKSPYLGWASNISCKSVVFFSKLEICVWKPRPQKFTVAFKDFNFLSLLWVCQQFSNCHKSYHKNFQKHSEELFLVLFNMLIFTLFVGRVDRRYLILEIKF